MTLRLSKNATNEIVLTLKERQTLVSPYWLFIFKHETDLETQYAVVLEDVSNYTLRYNEFSLTLPTDLDLTLDGQYRYFVYEQESSNNTDISLTTSLCEQGIAEVIPTPTTEYFNE